MAKRLELDYRLRLSNHHLSNIYDSGYYLEVGNLDANLITRIISGEELSFYDVINPSIAHDSPSKVANVEYDEILQMQYFLNKKAIDSSEKIFLTCGVLKWKSSKDSEIFAPIILIPIRVIERKHNQYYLKRSGKIIHNKYLSEEIKRRMGIDIPRFDKPETVFDIDYYGEFLAKLTNSSFELGNFITYARVDYMDIDLDRNKFSPQRSFMNYDLNEIHLYPLIHLNMILPANKEQKDALIVASEGKSFAIDGKLGTGKTTTAINIIANKIHQEQSVLYISNDSHQLKAFKQRVTELKLDKYMFDFDHPCEFIESTEEDTNIHVSKESYHKLSELTHKMTNIQKILLSKVCGYRYGEIYHQIAYLSRLDKASLSYPKIIHLHRHEIEQIIPSLNQIEASLIKLVPFEKSIWHSLHETLKASDEEKIKESLKQFKITQLQGQMMSKKLTELYHIQQTNDIRLIRRLIYNFNSLKNHQPSQSWIDENLVAYQKALKKIDELEIKIKQYYLVSEELSDKFDYRITSVNMDEVITGLFGEYFKETEVEIVNLLLQYKKQLLRIALGVENNKNNFTRLKGQLNNHFSVRKVELGTLEELSELVTFLERNEFNNKWIGFAINEKTQLLRKMKQFEEYFLSYQSSYVYILDSLVKNDLTAISELIEPFNKKGKAKGSQAKQELKRIKKYVKPHIWKDSTFNMNKLIQKLKKHIELDKDYSRQKSSYEEVFGELPERLLGLTDQLSNTINFLEKYRLNKAFPVRNYLNYYSRLSAPEQKNALKDLQTMILIQKEIEKNIEELKPFGFKVRSFHFESRLQEVTAISLYLKKMYRSNDYLKSLVLKPKNNIIVDDFIAASNDTTGKLAVLKLFDPVTIAQTNQAQVASISQNTKDGLQVNDYYYIKQLLEEKQNVLSFLEKSEFEYRYLYGSYYKGLNTEISAIRLALEKFGKFIKMIPNPEDVISLFQPDQYVRFQADFEQVSYFYEKWMVAFREYSKYFKENNIAYIDNTFLDNVKHIDELMKHTDSLKDYLVVLEHSNVLKEYKLDDIVKRIFNGELTNNIKHGFLYQYFVSLSKDFVQAYPEVLTLQTVNEGLIEIDQLTTLILDENKTLLQSAQDADYEKIAHRMKRIKPNNYNEMVKISLYSKYLYIADSDILLSGLDIGFFDCVIIDDAHIANSNKYVKVAEAKQLIIIGDKDAKSSIANNLISRIRHGNTIPLKFNYHRNNKILMDYKKEKDNNKGIIDDFLLKETGFSYIEQEQPIVEYITQLYHKEPNAKINIYVGNDLMNFTVYKQLANHLIETGHTKDQVLDILSNQIRISDARINYLSFADYNIFYYNDYIDIEEIVLEITLTSLMSVHKAFIIYHHIDPEQAPIIKKPLEGLIKYISKYKKWTPIEEQESIKYPLSQSLISKGFKVYQGFGNIDIIFKKKNHVYGIIVYNEPQKLDLDLIEDYENYVKTMAEQGIKIYMIFSKDVCERFDQVIEHIINQCEVQHDS